MEAPIELQKVWDAHVAEVLSDRDPRALSMSDLWGCDYALWCRLKGEPQLPRSLATFSAFERGHAYEGRVAQAFADYPNLHVVYYNEREVTLSGITGHPDFLLHDNDGPLAIIDVTTTASKYPEWSFGHALKSAAYAEAEGVSAFCEWVFSIGYGGNILGQRDHWFHLDESFAGKTWRAWVAERIAHVKAVSRLSKAPAMEPPVLPLDPRTANDTGPETWRCKSYCDNASCALNRKAKQSA